MPSVPDGALKFRRVALLNLMDDLVHWYFLTKKHQGFSNCGHVVTLSKITFTEPTGLLVNCVDCIAAGDEPNDMTYYTLHHAELQDEVVDHMATKMAAIIDEQLTKEAVVKLTEDLAKFEAEMKEGGKDARLISTIKERIET